MKTGSRHQQPTILATKTVFVARAVSNYYKYYQPKIKTGAFAVHYG